VKNGTIRRRLLALVGGLAVVAVSFFGTLFLIDYFASDYERNIIKSSGDPAQWPKGSQAEFSFGGNVSDYSGGKRARLITFPEADKGYVYASAPAINMRGKTLTGSVYLRSPGDQFELGLRLVNNAGPGEGNAVKCKLETTWKRCVVSHLFKDDAFSIQLGVENRTVALGGLKSAAGTIELCCAQLEVNSSATPYLLQK
jgi:hypothetical protein